MLRLLAERCTDALIRHEAIDPVRKAVYIYGFELFWSTFLCICSILTWGCLTGYGADGAVFLLFFMPVRTAAGGYHARSYRNCFLLTNCIALSACVISRGISRSGISMEISWLLFELSFFYIWRQAPFVSASHPLREEQISRSRFCARIILGTEAFALVILQTVWDGRLFYMAVVTTCTVAIMIIAAKGEEWYECMVHDRRVH